MTMINKPKPTYFQTIIIIVLVLFLIGLYLIITTHAGNISKILKENLNIVIELEDDLPQPERFLMMEDLKKDERVVESSVDFVSREEALEIMTKDMGESFLLTGVENPFFDIIKLNVKNKYQEKEKMVEFLQSLREKSTIVDAYYYDNIYEDIESNLKRIGYIALFSGILFVILAYALIHNTINIALYADRDEIKTMELVGADWSFIKKPYLVRSLKAGFLASIIAVFLLAGFFLFIHMNIYNLEYIIDGTISIAVCVALFIIAISFSLISTNFILHKYLVLRKEE